MGINATKAVMFTSTFCLCYTDLKYAWENVPSPVEANIQDHQK